MRVDPTVPFEAVRGLLLMAAFAHAAGAHRTSKRYVERATALLHRMALLPTKHPLLAGMGDNKG